MNFASVSGATFSLHAVDANSAFMSDTALDAASDLRWPISLFRNKNWRFRLDFSISSMSVSVNDPASPVPTPMRAKFLINSQPSAPAPTMKTLSAAIFACSALPNTAICPSYRDPHGAQSASTTGASESASTKSKWANCDRGLYLPDDALITSCPTRPPKNAATGFSFPLDPSASFSTRSPTKAVASSSRSSSNGPWREWGR